MNYMFPMILKKVKILCLQALHGLSGTLQGQVSLDMLEWLQKVMEELAPNVNSEEEIKQFTWNSLNSGQVGLGELDVVGVFAKEHHCGGNSDLRLS